MAKGLHRYTVQESQNVGLRQAGVILIDDTVTGAPRPVRLYIRPGLSSSAFISSVQAWMPTSSAST